HDTTLPDIYTLSLHDALPISPWYSNVPSWYDSYSMVALSVSTSASSSPFLTLSPTFLAHDAITPSSIVSLILGIRTISALIFDVSIACSDFFSALATSSLGLSAALPPSPPDLPALSSSAL